MKSKNPLPTFLAILLALNLCPCLYAALPSFSELSLIGANVEKGVKTQIDIETIDRERQNSEGRQLADSASSSPSIIEQMSSGLTKSLLPIDISKLPAGVLLHVDDISVGKDGSPVAYISITIKKGSKIAPLLLELKRSKVLPGASSFISMIGAIYKFSNKENMLVRAKVNLSSPKKLLASRTIVGSRNRQKGAFYEHKLVVCEKVLQAGIDKFQNSTTLRKNVGYYIKVPTFLSPYIPIPTGYRKIYRGGHVEINKINLRCKNGHLDYYGKVSGFVELLTRSRGVQINPSTFWGRVYPRKSSTAHRVKLKMKVTLWPKLDIGTPEIMRSMFSRALHPTALAVTLLARRLVHTALRKKMALEISGNKMKPTISRVDWHRFDASWGPVDADLTKLLCQLFGLSFKGRVKNLEVKRGQIELTLTSAK